MGADDRFAEINANKAALTDFLNQIGNSKDTTDLVIAGDLMDEWFLPMDYVMPGTLSEFYDDIVANNRAIVDAINRIISAGHIRVTYVPGNHDMLFSQDEAERIFPSINQARDAAGLGIYRSGDGLVEHGHRYSFTCAPDPLSNTDVTGGNSILPGGYFFTRIAASSISERMPQSSNVLPDASPAGLDETQTNYFSYYIGWKMLLTALPVTESFNDPAIMMGIDGYEAPCSVLDVVPVQGEDGAFHSALYGDVVENWPEREKLNRVAVPIATGDAIIGASTAGFTGQQAQTQYFDRDVSVRVVIFGHSHIAALTASQNPDGKSVIYANSGTWIDHPSGGPSCTYVVVTSSQGGTDKSVSLYQFNADKTSTLIQEASLED